MPLATIRIAILEDNPAFAEMLARHFRDRREEFCCVGVYGSAEQAMAGIADGACGLPDLVLVDLHLPGMSGCAFICWLREVHPQVVSVVLTAFQEDGLIFEALQAGACGYLLKRCSPDELDQAVVEAVAGGAPMSPQVARQVVAYFHQRPARREVSPLSAREEEIIRMLANGLLYKEIAVELQLSFETIRSYVKKIYDKLHVHSRTEAVLKWRGGR